MMQKTYFFEIADFSIDGHGSRSPAGMKMQIDAEIPEEEIVLAVAHMLQIDSSRVRCITEDEYREKYEDAEEDFDPDWEE